MSNIPTRFTLAGIIAGLMLADNWGDVADEINHLHDVVGMDRPEGNFSDGWTDEDRKRVGLEPEEKKTWPSEEPHNNANDCVAAGCDGKCGERNGP